MRDTGHGGVNLKRLIRADQLPEFKVEVGFYRNRGTVIYKVHAYDEEEAELKALKLARNDVSVYTIEPTDRDDEYDVTLTLAGTFGVIYNLTVWGRSQYDAEDNAVKEGIDSLVAYCEPVA